MPFDRLPWEEKIGFLWAAPVELRQVLFFILLSKRAKQTGSTRTNIFAPCYIKYVFAKQKKTSKSCYRKIYASIRGMYFVKGFPRILRKGGFPRRAKLIKEKSRGRSPGDFYFFD